MEVLNKEKVLELAKQLIEDGKIDKAIVEYRKLLDIDPKDMRIKIRIAELLIRQKKLADAVTVYMEVADSYGTDGFYLKAVTVYKNILRLNPSLIDINFKLAELYEKMGLGRDATYQYQILSNALEQQGDSVRLIEVRKRMVDLDPHNVSNRIRLAETYQSEGKEDESVNEYEELVEELKETGKTEQLMELYEKILSYRPDNIEMLRALAAIYYKRGEWKKIVARLGKKEKMIAKEADLLVILAEVYARLNQIETAKGHYKDAALIYIEREDIENALKSYKEILVIAPDDEAEVEALVAEIDEAYFEKVKTEATEKRQRIRDRLAEQDGAADLQEISTEEAALTVAASAKKDRPKKEMAGKDVDVKLHDADAAFELGRAYFQMGLSSEAHPELTKALTIYRELDDAGVNESVIKARINQIGQWLSAEETIDMRVEDIPTPPAPVKTTEPKKEAPKTAQKEKVLSETATKEAKKPETAKNSVKKNQEKDETAKKKRDKRMGFV